MEGRDSKGRFIKGFSSRIGIKTSDVTKEKQREAKLKNPTKYWLGKIRKDTVGNKHWNWKNGYSIGNNGYRYIAHSLIDESVVQFFKPGRSIGEHDYVWVLNNKRAIPKGYHVHHVNRNILDNRIENLQLLEAGDHTRKHLKGVPKNYFKSIPRFLPRTG